MPIKGGDANGSLKILDMFKVTVLVWTVPGSNLFDFNEQSQKEKRSVK